MERHLAAHPYSSTAPQVESASRSALKALRDDLKQRLERARAAPGAITVIDTNVLLHHQLPDSVAWREVVGQESVRLVIPLRVIEELDEKKLLRERKAPRPCPRAPSEALRARRRRRRAQAPEGRPRHDRGLHRARPEDAASGRRHGDPGDGSRPAAALRPGRDDRDRRHGHAAARGGRRTCHCRHAHIERVTARWPAMVTSRALCPDDESPLAATGISAGSSRPDLSGRVGACPGAPIGRL